MTDHPIPDSYWVDPHHLLAGEYPSARRERDARPRLGAILDAGVRSFVDLTDADDGLVPYETLVQTLARERGHDVAYRRMSVQDGRTLSPRHMGEVLAHIEREIAAGRPVYEHCWGGIGRTGTVAGCWMVAKQGRSARQAVDRIAQLRQGTPDGAFPSPETAEQRQFVGYWACAMAATPSMGLRDRCDALLKFAHRFDEPGGFATLVSPPGGDLGMIMPYCELSPWGAEFVQALEDAGWCVPFDWEAWQPDASRYVDEPHLLATADLDAVTKLITSHVRLDRRFEGHLADMAERGHLKAILERLGQLRDQ